MKKTVYFLTLVLALTFTSAFASNNVFRNSLTSQAGVGSVFVYDTWDYLVTPAFYIKQSNDAISMNYTPDQYDNKTFVMGGRHTLGVPLYWAVGLKNERQTINNYDPVKKESYKVTESPMHFRASIGTHFNGFGIGLYGEYLEQSRVYTNTTNAAGYTAGAQLDDATNNRLRAGINLGQTTSSNLVWSLGVGLRKTGGRYFENDGSGTVKEGLNSLLMVDGNLVSPSEKIEAEASTFGWVQLTQRGDRAYWRGDFTQTIDGKVTVKRPNKKADVKENKTAGTLFVGYAMAWPLSDIARFFIGPELGAEFTRIQTTAKNGAAGNSFSAGSASLGLSSAEQELKQGDASLAIKLSLPIVFQLPVVTNILTLQAGWYPEISLYQFTNKEQTDSKLTGKAVDNHNNRFLQSNVEKYGAGLTYTPVAALRLHLLFTTALNGNNALVEDRIDVTRVSLGVDYIFNAG